MQRILPLLSVLILQNGFNCLSPIPKTIFFLSSQSPTQTIYVESWKKGDRAIQEQVITIELGTDQRSYEAIISDKSETAKYKLRIDFDLYGLAGPRVEHYKVSLYESYGMSRLGKRLPNYNLLMREQPSSGKHYFPKDDSVGDFFPLEEVPFFKYGFNGFPVSAKRVVKVEGFYCVIQATSYKVGTKNPGTFESLTLQIEFRNNYKL